MRELGDIKDIRKSTMFAMKMEILLQNGMSRLNKMKWNSEIAIYFGMTGLPIRLLITTRRC